VTGSISDRHSDVPPPKPVLQTLPVPLTPPDCVSAIRVATLLATRKCAKSQAFAGRFDNSYVSPIMNVGASVSDDEADGISRLRLAQLSPEPLVLTVVTLPASVEAHIKLSDAWPLKAIVGIASMYNPGDPEDRDAGDAQTASGEMYDGSAWTAAIRTDLRGEFGGVRYGRNYRPTYALVEAGNKSAIIKINDVGPLAFGRVIDLNKRTMRYFDPSLQLGLIHDMRVIPLPGKNWKPGPVDDGGEKMMVASASKM
jgi:rare lipoprotein A